MFLEKFPYRVKFYTKHTCGVRVDGALPRGFVRFLSLTALRSEGCGIALSVHSEHILKER